MHYVSASRTWTCSKIRCRTRPWHFFYLALSVSLSIYASRPLLLIFSSPLSAPLTASPSTVQSHRRLPTKRRKTCAGQRYGQARPQKTASVRYQSRQIKQSHAHSSSLWLLQLRIISRLSGGAFCLLFWAIIILSFRFSIYRAHFIRAAKKKCGVSWKQWK